MKTSKVGNELMSDIEITGAVQNLEARMIETSPWYVGMYKAIRKQSMQRGKFTPDGNFSLFFLMGFGWFPGYHLQSSFNNQHSCWYDMD